jgi:LPXTG-site transpeptidase (sortase) family protein
MMEPADDSGRRAGLHGVLASLFGRLCVLGPGWYLRRLNGAVQSRTRCPGSGLTGIPFTETWTIQRLGKGPIRRLLNPLGPFLPLFLGISLCLAAWADGTALSTERAEDRTSTSLYSGSANAALATSATSTTVTTVPVSESDLRARASTWAQQLAANPEFTTCRLDIPEIGLDLTVCEMTEEASLDTGPGHWPETPLPGMGGDFVISGHRTLHGGPFLRLGELEVGDAIVVTLPYAVARYEVTRTLIVGWEDVEVVESKGLEELSLTTCHPPGRADSVMVVQALAVEFRLIDK